jgi:hypothetical protein
VIFVHVSAILLRLIWNFMLLPTFWSYTQRAFIILCAGCSATVCSYLVYNVNSIALDCKVVVFLSVKFWPHLIPSMSDKLVLKQYSEDALHYNLISIFENLGYWPIIGIFVLMKCNYLWSFETTERCVFKTSFKGFF